MSSRSEWSTLPDGVHQQLLALRQTGALDPAEIEEVTVAVRRHLAFQGSACNPPKTKENTPLLFTQRGS